MATPMTANQFLSALKAEGVNVKEHSGWRTHNRNHKGAWGPVNGIVIHHTAGLSSLSLCYNGTSALPGPLCHTHLSKAGVATMVGNGRCNHAGTFASNAFSAMVSESSTHPRPDASEPIDANSRTYGIEIENMGNGKDPYPAKQYDQAVRWAAAICRHHGWTEHSVIGHKEGTRRKIDPSFDMNAFRRDVGARLKGPAGGGSSSGGNSNEGLEGMNQKEAYDLIWKGDYAPAPSTSSTKDTNPTWMPVSVLVGNYEQTAHLREEFRAEVAELRTQLGEILALLRGAQ